MLISINAIIAVSADGVISKQILCPDGGKFLPPWSSPEDELFFRDTTRSDPMIMGGRTFLSMPQKLKSRLANRTTIVVSSSVKGSLRFPSHKTDTLRFASTLSQALKTARENADKQNARQVWVAGGKRLLQSFLELQLIDRLYVTIVEEEVGPPNGVIDRKWTVFPQLLEADTAWPYLKRYGMTGRIVEKGNPNVTYVHYVRKDPLSTP